MKLMQSPVSTESRMDIALIHICPVILFMDYTKLGRIELERRQTTFHK